MTQQTLIPVAEPIGGAQLPAVVDRRDMSSSAILALAIERGIDPDGLEKIVMLHERMEAKRAEHAFVDSMREFRKACPPLIKNRTAVDTRNNNKPLYDFLDLPGLQRVIDPLLADHGFSYKWDGEVTTDSITTTCILSHVDGHVERSKFTCQATGTTIMSQPQKAASATTFGRRYSLLGVLGLSAENDDDGAGATPPDPPKQRDGAPVAQSRSDRVTQEELKTLMDLWKQVRQKQKKQADIGAFGEWAQHICGVAPEFSRNVAHWTRDAMNNGFYDLEPANG